jgi:hypothetical protein
VTAPTVEIHARQIHSICSEILYGGFDTLDDFIEAWPAKATDDTLFAQIYADCQSAVEHTPAYLFSRAINWRAWRQSGLYDLLKLDRRILERVIDGQSLDEASSCRSYALDQLADDRSHRRETVIDECLSEPDPATLNESQKDNYAIRQADEICKLVQAGALTFKEFLATKKPDVSPALQTFLDMVYEDLEAAVEHTPGWWLLRGVDLKRWRQQLEYHRVELDKLLLDYLASGGSPTIAVATREAIEARLMDGVADTSYVAREVSEAILSRMGSLVISWPILVDNCGDVMFFRSLEGAQSYLEPIDVKNGEHVAYDREGRLLELGVERVPSRSWLGRPTWRERVVVDCAERDPAHVGELRQALTRYLGHLDSSSLDETLTMSQLMERAISYGDVC